MQLGTESRRWPPETFPPPATVAFLVLIACIAPLVIIFFTTEAWMPATDYLEALYLARLALCALHSSAIDTSDRCPTCCYLSDTPERQCINAEYMSTSLVEHQAPVA